MAKKPDEYSDQEAQARFEAALKGALKTPPKPLKDKPKTRKKAPRKGRPNSKRSIYGFLGGTAPTLLAYLIMRGLVLLEA